MAAPYARGEGAVCADNPTIGELHQALAAGEITAAALVQAYLTRIKAYDSAGPRLTDPGPWADTFPRQDRY